MWALLFAAAALLATPTVRVTAEAAASAGAVPITLDHDTWEPEVIETPAPVFVYFHAGDGSADPGSPVGKELTALAAKYTGIATVATVNCGDATIKAQLCTGAAAVNRVPHMRVYAAQKKRNPYTRSWYKEHEDYEGLPAARQMSMALQAQLVDDSITRVESMRDWENWDDNANLPKVLVFSKRKTPSILVRSMSLHFMNHLEFAVISPDVHELMDEYDVKAAPAVIVKRPSGDTQLYTGAHNAVELSDFLRKFAPEKILDEVNRKNLEDTAPIFEHAPNYTNVSLDEVPRLLQESEDIWLLFFYNNGAFADGGLGCADAARRFANVTGELGEMFKVGLVGATPAQLAQASEFVDAAAFEADACHTELRIKPFGDGLGGTDLEAHPGDSAIKLLLHRLYGLLPEYTTHVTEDAMPAFLGMHPGGLNPFTPKVILATNKLEAPPLFRLIAANFRRRDMAFGWYSKELDPGVAAQLPAPRLPFLMVAYIDPTTQADERGQVPLAMEPFTMPLKYTYIENFLETVSERTGRGGYQGGLEDDKEQFSGSIRHETGAVEQLQSDADGAELCTSKGGVCVIAFLDARSGSVEQDLGVVRAIRGVRRDQPLQFMWLDAATQPSFSQHFGITRDSLPSLVLYAPRKARFCRLHGAFDQAGISRMIDKLFTAQIATTPLPAMPSLVAGGEAPGAEAEEAPVEDEFSLEDIMDVGVEEQSVDREEQVRQALAQAEMEAARAAEEAAATQSKAKKAKRRRQKKKAAKKAHDEL